MHLDALRLRFPLFGSPRCYAVPDGAGGGGGDDDGAEDQINGADDDEGGTDDPDDPEYEAPERTPAGDRPERTPSSRRQAGAEDALGDDEGRPAADQAARLAELEQQLGEERAARLYWRGRAEGSSRREEPARREEPPVQLTDEQKAVKEEMLQLFPHIKLLDRIASELFGNDEKVYKALMQMGESAPALARQQQQYWDGVADRACTRATSAVAKLYSADPAKPVTLKGEVIEDVEDTFLRWIQAKKYPDRLKRYEAQDETLADDFAKYWEANYVAPHRRQDAAAEHQRDERRRRLPNGGGGGGRVGTPRRKPDPMDEDSVLDDAWKELQTLKGS